LVVHTIIPALRRLRQEDHNFKASLGYIGKPCPKTKKRKVDKRKCRGKSSTFELGNDF
jgi:hypothetical protein